MKDQVIGAMWRLGVFIVVCLVVTFSIVMVFAQLRFNNEGTYRAEFTNISGLKKGDFVRIAGVEVGKVGDIVIRPDTTVVVEFSVDDAVALTDRTKALIRFDNIIGDRFLQLQKGFGSAKRLVPGSTIPVNRTEPALDLDALIGGVRPLLRALDSTQVNALSAELVQAFQGQGEAVVSVLAQVSTLTSTLADHGALIEQTITNLNLVLSSLGDQSNQLTKTVSALADLMSTLAAEKRNITNTLAAGNVATGSIADLVARARPSLKNTVAQTDRVSSIALADHDYLDDLLNTLPEAYQALARQGMYGDFFTFYLCDVMLKLNGKGGQPVYVKVVSQSTGRCTPR